MTRILWLGNPPWQPSGYGEQAALAVPRLQAAGHDVAVAANFGLVGAAFERDGILTYPSDGRSWGNETLPTYAEHHQADLVFALCDAWVLHPWEWPDDLGAALWTPVDHFPIPPAVLATLAHERIKPVAMSRFGFEQMAAANLAPTYIPHCVDTALFRPRPEIRDKVRDELGVQRDAFLVGMVAANQGNPALSRKAFPQAFLAFAQFATRHPDAVLYCHSQTSKNRASGLNLDVLATAAGVPEGRLRFPNESLWHLGASRGALASMYAALDVLLMPSMGEGFGVPLIEAQACGVPVITSDHSAMRELCGSGWLVGGQPWWDELQSSFLIDPSIQEIAEALDASYEGARDPKLRAAGADFAAQYDADVVFEAYWKPALERLTAVEPSKPSADVVPLNREQRRRARKRSAV